jgi:undecaprenyl-diphosphatase
MIVYLHLVLIAAIQGITEFLPVSSSGHLVLLPNLTSLPDQGQTLDVAAHAGTMIAVMVYLRRDIAEMLSGLFSPAGTRTDQAIGARYLVGILILASLPVIIVGLFVEFLDPSFLRLTMTVAIANLICAGWLFLADKGPILHDMTGATAPQDTDKSGHHMIDWRQLSVRDACYIGLAQVIALIPGASRSGVTMTMARQLGYDRLSAARFSLLLSLPVIAGASLVKGASLAAAPQKDQLISAGIVAVLSFIFALGAIRWMMGWLSRTDFSAFVWYRLGLGIVLLGYLAIGG